MVIVLPEWRNWQTRQVEGLVAFTGSAGSSPVSGTLKAKGLGQLTCSWPSSSAKILLLLFRWRGTHMGVPYGFFAAKRRFFLLPVLLPRPPLHRHHRGSWPGRG